jgi:hypothetical protein
MSYFFQLLVTGLSLGMMYALIAIGFVVIFKCSQAFNIASGQVVMLGAYLGYTFLIPLKLPVWAAVICAIIVAAIMGLVIERFALRPLLGQPALSIVMMTIALAGVMDGIAIMGWGGEYQTYHQSLPEISLTIGSVSVPPSSMLGLIVSLFFVIILVFASASGRPWYTRLSGSSPASWACSAESCWVVSPAFRRRSATSVLRPLRWLSWVVWTPSAAQSSVASSWASSRTWPPATWIR